MSDLTHQHKEAGRHIFEIKIEDGSRNTRSAAKKAWIDIAEAAATEQGITFTVDGISRDTIRIIMDSREAYERLITAVDARFAGMSRDELASLKFGADRWAELKARYPKRGRTAPPGGDDAGSRSEGQQQTQREPSAESSERERHKAARRERLMERRSRRHSDEDEDRQRQSHHDAPGQSLG